MKKKNNFISKKKSVKVEKQQTETSESEPVRNTSIDEEDQGFGGWLRSEDGLETMKLFVIANSIVMLTTIVYPHLQNVYGILTEMFYGDDYLEEL